MFIGLILPNPHFYGFHCYVKFFLNLNIRIVMISFYWVAIKILIVRVLHVYCAYSLGHICLGQGMRGGQDMHVGQDMCVGQDVCVRQDMCVG